MSHWVSALTFLRSPSRENGDRIMLRYWVISPNRGALPIPKLLKQLKMLLAFFAYKNPKQHRDSKQFAWFPRYEVHG